MIKIKIKKTRAQAITPTYAKEGDAGLDMYSSSFKVEYLPSGHSMITYYTGIAIEIPEGYYGQLHARSSIYKHSMSLCNGAGILDSGYRGEILFKYYKIDQTSEIPQNGDRIGQMLVLPYPKIELEEVESLSATDRGEGGFGSTGI
ncbi:MAG: dUTP diphosphatase [Mangrovimonas sp.]|nr:dUTP diphosphatase [Mangrovimonas sp.]